MCKRGFRIFKIEQPQNVSRNVFRVQRVGADFFGAEVYEDDNYFDPIGRSLTSCLST